MSNPFCERTKVPSCFVAENLLVEFGLRLTRIISTYLLTYHLDLPLKDIVQLPMMSTDQGSVLQESVPQNNVPTVSCGSFHTYVGKMPAANMMTILDDSPEGLELHSIATV